MIPKGAIYSELRTEALSFFKRGCNASPSRSQTFVDWLADGAYVPETVPGADDTASFTAGDSDVGRSIMCEIEYLFDHCFEHLQEMACYTSDNRPRSEAWQITTIYYFSFFTAQSLLRMLGRPVLFLKKQDLANLSAGAGPPRRFPSGVYRLNRAQEVSATHGGYCLKPIKGSLHEKTWKTLLEHLDQLSSRQQLGGNVNEVHFYHTLTTKVSRSRYAGFEWPSAVRNKANYRPGFAYQLFAGQHNLGAGGLLKRWEKSAPQGVISNMELSLNTETKEPFAYDVGVLHDLGITLFILARDLYSDLMQRLRLDRRWELRRKKILCKSGWLPRSFPDLGRTF